MADRAWELLAHVIQHPRSYREVLARKIDEKMFPTKEQRDVFSFLQRFHRKYKRLPKLRLLTKRFPQGEFTLTVEEPTAFYLDGFIRQYLRHHGSGILLRAAENLGDDPVGVFEDLRGQVSALLGKSAPTHDSNYAQNWKARYRDYLRRKRGELLGVPTPFETWNAMTFGWQPEDYIVITARPKVGKTWFMLVCAKHAKKLGQRVLFFTKEMSIRSLERRLDAMMYCLPWNAFRRGALTEDEQRRYKRGLERTARLEKKGRYGPLRFSSDPYLSVSLIEAKIEEFRPTVVFVDGLYLVRDAESNRDQYARVSNVSREVRSLAQAYRLPIIATSQIHRMPGNLERTYRSLTLGDLAFSDAISQDAEQVLALIRTEDMRLRNMLLVKPLAIREEDPRDWGVHWDIGTMQETFHEVPLEDEPDAPIGDEEAAVDFGGDDA